jgi:hypothetical protein
MEHEKSSLSHETDKLTKQTPYHQQLKKYKKSKGKQICIQILELTCGLSLYRKHFIFI